MLATKPEMDEVAQRINSNFVELTAFVALCLPAAGGASAFKNLIY